MPLQEPKLIFFIFFSSLLTLSTGESTECHTGVFKCPEDKQNEFPLSFADPNDCNFFHICYSLQKSHRDSCGPGAHFDGQMCEEGLCPTAIPGCQPQEPADNTPGSGYFECPGMIGDGNPAEYPDTNDCQYFFICYTLDIMLRLSCGDNRHFDGGSCVAGECPTKIPGAEPLVPKDTDCDVKKFECATDGYSEQADPNDCNFYFVCNKNNIVVRSRCEPEHHFEGEGCIPGVCPSTVRDICEHPSATTEMVVTTTEAAITTPVNPNCKTGYRECGQNGGRFHDENDCRYYFVCLDTGITRKDCGEGRHKHKRNGCDDGPCPFALPGCKPQEAGRPCQTGKFVCPQKHPTAFYSYPDPNNCRYWYACFSTGPYRRDCGFGMHWEGNPNGGRCVAGQCQSAVPNCMPLDQDRECVTGYRTCPENSVDTTDHDLNDCRYYFVCSEDGITREDCGEGWHKHREGKCEIGPCPFALPGCSPLEPSPPPQRK